MTLPQAIPFIAYANYRLYFEQFSGSNQSLKFVYMNAKINYWDRSI